MINSAARQQGAVQMAWRWFQSVSVCDCNLMETLTSGWSNNKSETVDDFYYFSTSLNRSLVGSGGCGRTGRLRRRLVFMLRSLEVQGSVAVMESGCFCCSAGCKFYFTSNPSDKTLLSFFMFCLCVLSQCFVYIFNDFQGCVDASGLVSSICGGVSINLYKKTLFCRLMLLS